MKPNESTQVAANRVRPGVVVAIAVVCILIVFVLKLIKVGPFDERPESAARAKSSQLPESHAHETNSAPEHQPKEQFQTTPDRATPHPPIPPSPVPKSLPPSAAVTEPTPVRQKSVPREQPPNAPRTGSIVGRVKLLGQQPREVGIQASDPVCGTNPVGASGATRFYGTSPDGGLVEVFVYISSGAPVSRDETKEPLVIDQQGCWFTPYISGAQLGQTILIRNSDKTLHNVRWTPRVVGNPESNKLQLPNGPDLAYLFAQPEVFLRLKCDVHPWMFAYVGLVDHPFFSITGADGRFSLTGVPPGRYSLKAVHRRTHPDYRGIEKEVVVESGAVTDVEFQVQARPPNQ